jgi:hypothetical protein
MRYLVSLAVAAALLTTAAVPAQATTIFRRNLITDCHLSKIRVENVNSGQYWTSSHPCREAKWDFTKQTYYYIDRPWTDAEGADDAAAHWWPSCFRDLEDVTDFGDGHWDWIYRFACA